METFYFYDNINMNLLVLYLNYLLELNVHHTYW